MENTDTDKTGFTDHRSQRKCAYRAIRTQYARHNDFRLVHREEANPRDTKGQKKHKYLQLPMTYLHVPTITRNETPAGDNHSLPREFQHKCNSDNNELRHKHIIATSVLYINGSEKHTFTGERRMRKSIGTEAHMSEMK
jgi:hypothetical protein